MSDSSPPAREQSTRPDISVIWHEVECGGYSADLVLWDELAEAAAGPVLELGCGSGRVTAHLAAAGHEVIGLDVDPNLLRVCAERLRESDAQTELGDACDFDLGREFALVLAPMQLMQLLGGSRERAACLSRVRRHLRLGGRGAFAIVEGLPAPEAGGPPLPDVREVDGWVYSSLPVETRAERGALSAWRLRHVVSPDGSLSDEEVEIRLDELSAEVLEREAREAGLTPTARRLLPPTDAHVGSTVVLVERRS
jgi:SAM-dependent methyltransferase